MVTLFGSLEKKLDGFLQKNKKLFNYQPLPNRLVKIQTSLDGVLELYKNGFDNLQVLENQNFLSLKRYLQKEVTLKALQEGVTSLRFQHIVDLETLEPIGSEFFCGFAFHPFLLMEFLLPLDLTLLDIECVRKILKETRNYRKTKLVFINTFTTSWDFGIFKGSIVEMLERENPDLRKNIVLEVVETGSIDLKIFECLKQKYSIKVAIDDFGSERASIERLGSDKVDFVKIDKKLLWDDKLFSFLSSLAEKLTKYFRVIAEGVETEEHLAKIKALGIHYGQGFYFHKPQPWEGS